MTLRDRDRTASRSERRPSATLARESGTLFAALSAHSAAATILKLAPRQRLVLSSGLDDTVFAVRQGVILGRAQIPHSPVCALTLQYGGDVIVPEGLPHFAERSLVAATAAEVWRFKSKAFQQALADNPDLLQIREAAHNRQQARAALHATLLSCLDGAQRFAGFLIEMAREVGVASGPTIAIDLPLSRVEIAQYLALNADTLSRLMSRFKSDGLISQSSRHHIALKDWKAVAALCPIAPALIALGRERPSPLG